MTGRSTRDEIVAAADRRFYENGFEATSFADIAADVNISRGNFYHHFRSKDAILAAVIELRLQNTQAMLERWQQQGSNPQQRIISFIGILLGNRGKIMRFGCPVGTLCQELAKLEHLAQADAVRLFTLFRGWLGRQFIELGHGERADALALHVLARSQGIATLANAFHDEAFIHSEVGQLMDWLNRLTTPPRDAVANIHTGS